MVKNNELVIPKNIERPIERSLNDFNKTFETVYEIENEKEYQIPSFEEFLKNYKVDNKVGNSYNGEFIE